VPSLPRSPQQTISPFPTEIGKQNLSASNHNMPCGIPNTFALLLLLLSIGIAQVGGEAGNATTAGGGDVEEATTTASHAAKATTVGMGQLMGGSSSQQKVSVSGGLEMASSKFAYISVIVQVY
jgi:hypothetical protein